MRCCGRLFPLLSPLLSVLSVIMYSTQASSALTSHYLSLVSCWKLCIVGPSFAYTAHRSHLLYVSRRKLLALRPFPISADSSFSTVAFARYTDNRKDFVLTAHPVLFSLSFSVFLLPLLPPSSARSDLFEQLLSSNDCTTNGVHLTVSDCSSHDRRMKVLSLHLAHAALIQSAAFLCWWLPSSCDKGRESITCTRRNGEGSASCKGET